MTRVPSGVRSRGPNPVPPVRRDDKPGEVRGHGSEGAGDRVTAVPGDLVGGDLVAGVLQAGDERDA